MQKIIHISGESINSIAGPKTGTQNANIIRVVEYIHTITIIVISNPIPIIISGVKITQQSIL